MRSPPDCATESGRKPVRCRHTPRSDTPAAMRGNRLRAHRSGRPHTWPHRGPSAILQATRTPANGHPRHVNSSQRRCPTTACTAARSPPQKENRVQDAPLAGPAQNRPCPAASCPQAAPTAAAATQAGRLGLRGASAAATPVRRNTDRSGSTVRTPVRTTRTPPPVRRFSLCNTGSSAGTPPASVAETVAFKEYHIQTRRRKENRG